MMNKNIKIAKQLIKIAQQLIEDQKASNSQLNKLQGQMDDQTLKLFEQFKQEAEHRVIRLASGQSKAKSMIEQGILKSKSLSGKALKVFLLALVTFVSLHCSVTKADVVDLDNSGQLRQVLDYHAGNSKNEEGKKTIQAKNLDKFIDHLCKNMKGGSDKLRKAVQSYKSQIGEDGLKGKTVNDFLYQLQKKDKQVDGLIQDAFMKLRIMRAGRRALPILEQKCAN